MGRNREFLSELKLVFHGKNDGKKDANIDIQTYLLFGNQVQSFPAIKQMLLMLSGGE